MGEILKGAVGVGGEQCVLLDCLRVVEPLKGAGMGKGGRRRRTR